jgi:streptomycin 6-kinase
MGPPCPERVVAQALTFAERRAAAFDVKTCVVVHGDPHPGNALRALHRRAGAESGFCFVDPDGFLCDRAYDLGVVLRDWSKQLRGDDARAVAEGYCRLLAERSGIDEQSVWEWGYTERVSTGLYAMAFGARAFGQGLLDSARRLVD